MPDLGLLTPLLVLWLGGATRSCVFPLTSSGQGVNLPHTPQLKWLVRRTNEGHEESTAVADPFLGEIRFVADPGLSGHRESQDSGPSEASDGEIEVEAAPAWGSASADSFCGGGEGGGRKSRWSVWKSGEGAAGSGAGGQWRHRTSEQRRDHSANPDPGSANPFPERSRLPS